MLFFLLTYPVSSERNGRKTITTLQGVPTEYDPRKLLKAFKKEFACNGSLVDGEDMGQVIQLQGDQRTKIHDMLVEEGISDLEELCRKTTTRR
jgi:translation initiation factor 1